VDQFGMNVRSRRWLCLSDARQVSDLPARALLLLRVSDQVLAVIDRRVLVGAFGQVEEVPRIGVAEP